MIDESSNVFGINLKRMMKTKHVNQIELSKEIGVTQTMLSRYITGKSNPTIYKVHGMAEYMGCSIDELMREPIDQKQKGETDVNN